MTALILHIGWHRTATTTIQHALHDSRELLVRKGVLYPLTGLHGSSHHSIAWGVTERPINGWGSTPDFQNLVDQLTEEIRSSACDTVIISTEALRQVVYQPNRGPGRSRLTQLLALFSDVRVLCCVRHQAPQLESSYRFLVGWEHNLQTDSFREYVNKLPLSQFIYADTEQFFCDLRPDIRFQFWSFSEAVASGNVIDRFFDVAGIEKCYPVQLRVNGALSREATLALLEWNRAGINQRPDRKIFVDWATEMFPETGTSLYDPELLAIVGDTFAESNALLEVRTGLRFLDTPVASGFSARCAGQSLHPEQLAHVHAQLDKRGVWPGSAGGG